MQQHKKTKVVFLSPVGHFKGGAERCLIEFIDNPAIEPVLVAPNDGPIIKEGKQRDLAGYVLAFGNIETIHRPFSFIDGFKALYSLVKAALTLKTIAGQENARIVHSNGLKAHAINCTSRLLGGAKAIIHIHDIPLTRQEKLLWRILYHLCDSMILVSRPCWPGQNLPARCKVIHNGTPLFELNTPEKGDSEKPSVTAGFIGRIHPAKGLHLLLEWIAKARNAGTDVILSVRGTFSEDALGYQKEIEDLIAALGLTSCVSFLGFIDNPEKVYEGLDVVVVPSQIPDPLPRSVMEPMARGIPVMGYPAGGIPEMIEDGGTGFLVSDATSFSSALNALAQNREIIIKQAREKISREFSMETLYRELDKTYENVQGYK